MLKNTTLLNLKKDQVFQLGLSYDASYDFCFWYIITWKSFYCIFYHIPPIPVLCVWFHPDNVDTNQNTTLTIIHANHIMANQISAFLRTFHPPSYHFESAHDVNILNHQYIQKHNVTVARIPRHRLIAFLTVSNKPALVLGSFVWMVSTPSTWHFFQYALQSFCANVIGDIVTTIDVIAQKNVNNLYINVFMVCFF